MTRVAAAVLVSIVLGATATQDLSAQWLLVPMDRQQQNHLRAYGLTYWTLEQGEKAEWLLNYRGGSFLLPDLPDVRREAAFRGVSITAIDAPAEARIRATIDGANMEAVPPGGDLHATQLDSVGRRSHDGSGLRGHRLR